MTRKAATDNLFFSVFELLQIKTRSFEKIRIF